MNDLAEIVRDIWHYRDLFVQLTLRDVRIRYKQAVMGFGWAVFMPALIVLAGMLVRYAMAHVAGMELDRSDITGLVVKALPWAFFVGAVGFATNSLTSNMMLVTKVYFPRELLPLSATCCQAFDFAVGATVLLFALPILGVRPSLALVWVPILVTLLFVFTVAVALFLSCANLFCRDVKYIVQVLLTFGIFFTPVLFEPAMLGPKGAQVAMLNPLAPMLEGLRLSVTQGHNLLLPLTPASAYGKEVLAWSPWYLGYSALWAFGGILGSVLVFRRLEFVFAEHI